MNSCECVFVLVSFSRPNPTTPLISSYPPHPSVPTSGFSFNEMFGSLHSLYLFSFILSLSSNLSAVFPSLIVFGLLSVILQGKVIKGRHIEGGSHCFVILFCWTSLLSFIFVCGSRPYQGDGREIRSLWFFVVK